MAFCGNCGRQIPTGYSCTICGGDAYNKSGTLVADDPSSETLSTWSDSSEKENISTFKEQYYQGNTMLGQVDSACDQQVISTMLISACCCPLLGIISFYFLIDAKANNIDIAKRNLKYVTILNAIAVISWFIIALVLVLFVNKSPS